MVPLARGVDARELARLFQSISGMVSSADTADAFMTRALNLVCAFTGWPVGHVYLVDRRAMQLVPTDIWHVEDPERFAPFVEARRRTRFPFGVGLPGRILSSGAPAWITDVGSDPNFPRVPAALQWGTGAAFGFPIVSALGVEGILEFLTPGRTELDDSLLDLLSHIGRELGHALDRARARAALAASEARLAEAERLGHLGAWLYHVDEDLLEWSAELCSLYGLDPASTPTTLDEYLSRVYPDDLERVRGLIATTIEKGQPFEHEYRLVLRPREICWAHSRGEVLVRGAGRSLQLAGYCQDITDRKLREEAVSRGQERLAEAQRIAHLGSWSWAVRSNSVNWSDELFRIYGLEPGSAPATFEAYLDRVHPEDREQVRGAVRRTAATLEPFEHDYRVVRPDGKQRWVHARGEVVEQVEGVATRFAGYCHDFTERRLAEEERDRMREQLRQSQRLESLGQLAGGVAHDFNNLLAVILSCAAFVDEEIAALATPATAARSAALREDVELIRHAARRAADLTRQLLAFGRRQVVRPRVLSLDDVVRDVEQLLRRTLGERVELRTAGSPELWKVWADPGQLEQVLVNLALNARDAMPSGGTLTIETANVDLDPAEGAGWVGVRPGRHVLLRVSDSGHGMAREVAERAFEPFFTTKPEGEGSGLGLAIVYGIVAQAGGGVRIETAPGRGTAILVLLPAIDEESSRRVAPEPPARTHRRDGSETVLLVENDEAMRGVTRRMLARHGYGVIAAASGAEAIETARRRGGDIQLLVTDVLMPGMLGSEAAARIRAVLPAIRVLYVSGVGQLLLASKGALEQSAALLEKPFSEEELLDAVREVLDRPSAANSAAGGPGTASPR